MQDIEAEISKIKNEMLDKVINNTSNMDGFLKDIDDLRKKDPTLHSTLVSMYSAYKIELDELKNNNLITVAKIADIQLSMIRKIGVEIVKFNKPSFTEMVHGMPMIAKTLMVATVFIAMMSGLYRISPEMFNNIKDFLGKVIALKALG